MFFWTNDVAKNFDKSLNLPLKLSYLAPPATTLPKIKKISYFWHQRSFSDAVNCLLTNSEYRISSYKRPWCLCTFEMLMHGD